MASKEVQLTTAAMNGNIEKVTQLLDEGVDVNVKTGSDKQTALMLASVKKHIPVIELLLGREGIDINAQDKTGTTALALVMSKGLTDVAKLLIERGADPNIQDKYKTSSVLLTAVVRIDKDTVELLLNHGANPNLRLASNTTPLMFTPMNKSDLTPIARLLLDKGADPNAKDDKGKTALMGASKRGNANLIKLLLERGADKTIKDNAGKTALDYAKTPEIGALFDEPAEPDNSRALTGTPAAEVNYFDVFLGKADTEEEVHINIKKHTFCPVCLGHAEREGECSYITHKCPEDKRHTELYTKYKNAAGEISWCTECGRCAKDGKHYKFDLAMRDAPVLLPTGATCEASGGGGVHEKMQRVVRYIDYLYDLEHAVGEITEDSARKELIEEVWNAPARRVRFDPSKYKKFKTDTTVFKAGGGRVMGMYETDVQCMISPKKAGKRRTLKINRRKNK